VNKFKNSNRYGRPVHVSSLYKFRLPKFNMPAAPLGTLAYADDVVLIAPTASALRKMLIICDSFATEYCVSVNAKKSKCLVALLASKRCLYAQLSVLSSGWQTNRICEIILSSRSHYQCTYG